MHELQLNDPRFNIKLVKLIKQHPCLYNYTLPEYSRKDISDSTWLEISQQVNVPVSVCKEKWKNIRTVFVRHLKTGSTSSTPQSRMGHRTKVKRPYYMRNKMQFIIPYLKINPNSIDLNETARAEPGLPGSIKTESEIKENYEPAYGYDIGNGDDVESEATNDCQNVDAVNDLSVHNRNEQADKNETDCVNCNRSRTDLDESRKLFLLSLLPELDQMTNEQMRKFKRNVLTLIDDILE